MMDAYAIGQIIEDKIDETIRIAKGEQFEDGMDSVFATQIIAIIKKHGVRAVDLAWQMCRKMGGEILHELLITLGRIDDPPTYNYRRQVIKMALYCYPPPSRVDLLARIQIVDGALAAIGVMDDVDFIPCLEFAIKREKHIELRGDIQQVLDSLKG